MKHRKLMAIGPKKMLWGKEHIDEIRHHNYDEILATPRSMYDWLNGKFQPFNREERQSKDIRIIYKFLIQCQFMFFRFVYFWICNNQ